MNKQNLLKAFGTCIAVFDGYARAIKRTTELLFTSEKPKNIPASNKTYIWTILIIVIGSLLIIEYVNTTDFGIKGLVNYATTLSFIVAPFIAVFNIILVTKSHIEKNIPPVWMQILSYTGVAFLVGFSIYFLFMKFGG